MRRPDYSRFRGYGSLTRRTIQWEFSDAEPWHLVVANGSTRVESGRIEWPTVTIRCRYEDWADVVGGRENPLRLAARGGIRPKGDFRWLSRAQDIRASIACFH